MPQIAANDVVTNATMLDPDTGLPTVTIDANGKYHVFRSNEISTNNNKAMDATLLVHDITPDRSGLGRSKLMFILERKDDAGNWFPVHSLYQPVEAIAYGPDENGGIIPTQQLSYGPLIFNFDGNVSIDSSDGENIIIQDHQKRGVLPDKVRLCVLVHERDFGTSSAFQSVEFSIDYELRPE